MNKLQVLVVFLAILSIAHSQQSYAQKNSFSSSLPSYKDEAKYSPSSKGQKKNDTTCVLDRNSTRGDFSCSMQTCYNHTTGLVSSYRTFCFRVKNGIASIEERSDRLISAYHKPMIELFRHVQGVFKDWVMYELLERLWKMSMTAFV